MEVKSNTELGRISIQPDPLKRTPNYAALPGRDINNKLVDSTQKAMGALRPSDQKDMFEVQGSHVNYKA